MWCAALEWSGVGRWVGCVRVVDALSLFLCGASCVVTLWSIGVPPLSGVFVDFGPF